MNTILNILTESESILIKKEKIKSKLMIGSIMGSIKPDCLTHCTDICHS